MVNVVVGNQNPVADPSRRANVVRLEEAILSQEQVECPVEHFFAPGMYARQMTVAQGVTLTGKIHRHSHLNVLSKGHLLISHEFGQQQVIAPSTWVSEPGIKRAIYALEDSVFTTFHATNSTDLDELESELIAESYAELEATK